MDNMDNGYLDEQQQQQFDNDVVNRLRSMLSADGTAWTRDNKDIDLSRAVGSGFGWSKEFKDFFGPAKPTITVNKLRSYCNDLVATYDRSPFKPEVFSRVPKDLSFCKQIFEGIINESNLQALASAAIRYNTQDGYSFFLIVPYMVDEQNNLQSVKIVMPDARRVFISSCDDPTGKDVDFAAIVDIESKSSVMSQYDLSESEAGSSGIGVDNFSLPSLDSNQCYVFNAYEKMSDGVMISKIVGTTVVAQSKWAISRIPIYRGFGELVEIDKRKHYRGVYHFIAELSKALNLYVSLMQNRAAKAEEANWVADARAIKNPQQWNDPDVNVRVYSGGDVTQQIAPPAPVNKSIYIGEILSGIETITKQIDGVLGAITPEQGGNKTAEEVMSNRETKNAVGNMYLRNLMTTIEALCNGVIEFIGIIYDVPRVDLNIPAIDVRGVRVKITAGPIEYDKQLQQLQQLTAFYQMAGASGIPSAGQVILPEILNLSDIDQETKQRIYQGMFANQPTPQMQAMQAQMQQAAQQLQQAQAYIAQLENLLNSEKFKVQAQVQMNEADNMTELTKKQMELSVKQGDQQIKVAELIAEQQQAREKSSVDLAKAFSAQDVVVVTGNEMNSPMGRF